MSPGTSSTWQVLDLAAALSGDGVDAPSLLERDDGRCLLYPGRIHWFSGEPESCKSWCAQLAVARVLHGDGSVLYLDYEDDENGIVERLRSLSVDDQTIADAARFAYLRPEEPVADKHGNKTDAARDYGDRLATKPALVVVDGVTEAMTTEGLNLIDNADVARFMRRICRPAAAVGAAVIAVDHVTKSNDERRSWAIGGQHKKAGVTGAAYTFDKQRPFGRGLEGRVRVTVEKDRPGHVRAYATEKRVATMVLSSYDDGGVTIHLEAPTGEREEPNTPVLQRIEEHLTVYPGAGKTALRELGNSDQIDDAIKWLVARERVRVQQKGQKHEHYLVDVEL
jgi:hypothetical protein